MASQIAGIKAYLWGPSMWDLLFACALNTPPSENDTLYQLLIDHLSFVIPCPTCADHYRSNIPVISKRVGHEPTDSETSFKWLYELKSQINKDLKKSSKNIQFEDFLERCLFHAHSIDLVRVCDLLVLVSIYCENAGTESAFLSFCGCVSKLVPSKDETFVSSLTSIQNPIVASTYRMCRLVRIRLGMQVPILRQYKLVARSG
jgi:hypothetical protein